MQRDRLGQEVSPQLELLAELRGIYPWLPGPDNIRPSDSVKATKAASLVELLSTWISLDDYILCSIFGQPKAKNSSGQWYCADRTVTEETRVFAPNQFPYDNLRCNHWLLWYGCKQRPFSSDTISEHIRCLLENQGSEAASADFIWYENPKMSLPEYFHVHVFWVAEDQPAQW